MISPQLLRAAAELAELGVGVEGALKTAEKLRRHADGVARAFVDLFVTEVWQPFDRAGRPEANGRMSEALERMRPLAAGALLAIFQIAMGEAVEKEGERTLRLAARPKKRSAGARAELGESRVVELVAGRLAAGVGEDGEIHQRGEQFVELLGLAFCRRGRAPIRSLPPPRRRRPPRAAPPGPP